MLHFCLFQPFLRKLWRKYRCLIIMAVVVGSFVYFHSKVLSNREDINLSSVIFRTFKNKTFPDNEICIHPKLQLYHPSINTYFHTVKPLRCTNDTNWIVVENGTFFISQQAKELHGHISCQYSEINRGPGDYKITGVKPVKLTQTVTKLPSDFIKVFCLAKDRKRYFNVHAGISFNTTIHERINGKTFENPFGLNLSVLMFGFDSVSRMTWERKLRKTHSYFTRQLGGIVLDAYNIVGDGTPQALLPILTGHTESELPEARRGKSGAKPVDGHPWIWKDFQNAGYVTQWTEDMANIGTFNYRMKGFQNQPVDHYMRPFYLAAEKMYAFNPPYCLGSMTRHQVLINWIRDSFLMYGFKKKFIFGFHSEYSHENSNNLEWVDEDLLKFLKFLNEFNYLNETIIMLMSDHGARFHAIRDTTQGKLEERMPYFAFRFPPSFKHKYPKAFQNFMINSKRLTTPFDIYATFKHMLNFMNPTTGDLNDRGISLFDEIPKNRSCAHASIAPHWCACLQWKKVEISSKFTKTAAIEAVKFLNSLTSKLRNKCHKLSVYNVTKHLVFKIDKNITMFRGSHDDDGRIAEFQPQTKGPSEVYQVSFITSPGGGKFEVTYVYTEDSNDRKYLFNEKEISRINKYGHSADCISDHYPNLRQFCYCIQNRTIKNKAI